MPGVSGKQPRGWGSEGRPRNVQGASQLMHEESYSRRSTTPVTHRDASGRTSMCESRTESLRTGRRAVRKRASVGTEGRQPARRPPATPPSPSQVNPGSTADNSERQADERLMANTFGGGPRCQKTAVCIKASNRVRKTSTIALHLGHQ